MKRVLLSLFLMIGLVSASSTLISMELEGQDDTGDFLIEEMNEQYPEDTEYFAEEDYMMPDEEDEDMEEEYMSEEEPGEYEDVVEEDIFE